MSVTVNPHTIGFNRPLTDTVKRSFRISNPHSSPIAFKVKTTAPKQYCVRPNQGRVEPNQAVDVIIVFQPLEADPPPHAKCKDKFLVQSTFIPPDEEIRSLPEMWATVESTNKAAIHEQKIRCAYLAAPDGLGNPNGIPEENEEAGDHSKLDESTITLAHSASTGGLSSSGWTFEPERDYSHLRNDGYSDWNVEAPQPAVEEAEAAPVPPNTLPVDHDPVPLQDLPSCPDGASSAAIFSAAEASPAPKANGAAKDLPSTPTPAGFGTTEALSPPSPTVVASREIPSLSAADVAAIGVPTNVAFEKSLDATTSDSDKLIVALAEIERLKAQVTEAQGPTVTGLRKRGGAGADAAGAKTTTAVAPAAASGVPVEVCAGLVFAVFVLTYLFF